MLAETLNHGLRVRDFASHCTKNESKMKVKKVDYLLCISPTHYDQLQRCTAVCSHGWAHAEQTSARKWRLSQMGQSRFLALPSNRLHVPRPNRKRDPQRLPSAELTGLDLLWCAIPLLAKQPFSMSTNGVFVVLHEKRGGRWGSGLACAPWRMLMSGEALRSGPSALFG